MTTNVDHSPTLADDGRPRRRRLVRRGRRGLVAGLLLAALGGAIAGLSAIASGVLLIVAVVVVLGSAQTMLAGVFVAEAAADVRPGGGFSALGP